MSPIIDFHTHLGDVLYPNGGRIIEKKGVRKKWYLDALLLNEATLWTRGGRLLSDNMVIRSGLVRSASATRQNLRRAMDAAGVTTAVTLAVPPNVTFADLKAACDKDPSMLPFTSIEYRHFDQVEAQLRSDVQGGARGLKLHPILQRVRLNSKETLAAVEAFAPYQLPVLFHAGESEYYLKPSEKGLAKPEFGRVDDAAALISAFPKVKFVVGHAGLSEMGRVIELFAGKKNVWVEISFQNAAKVQRLIEAFGVERVLYGSDWPWGNMKPALKIVRRVCGNDKHKARRILYKNAAELLCLQDY